MASSGSSEEALIDQINNGFLKTIRENGDFKDANTLLYDLIYGKTTPVIAAADFMGFARANQDTQPYLENLSMQVLSLACNYPFLQPQLVCLVVSIMHSPPASSPDEVRSCFKNSFATLMGDWASSNYGQLFDTSKHSPGLIRDHIHLNRFIARLLSSLGESKNPEHRLTGLNDALFILSTSLEDHSDSHDLPDVDVPAAAQYMIHAGEFFFEESNKGERTGQNLAAQSPLWATKGKLWSKQPGLSRHRWDFWKSRFKEIAGSGNLAHTTAIDADTAMRAMIAVEKSGEVRSGNISI